LVFAGYLTASILVFALPVIGHMSTRYLGLGAGDARFYTWALGWWPHAISSGLNPLHPTVVWAPTGVNLAWVAGVPGPALAAWPITALFGPVVSLNVWLALSPALAAWAAYLLCKEVTQRFWPAVAGGYLFGFSSYMAAEMRGHVNLTLIFPIPLAVYLTVRFVRGGISRRAYTLLLTLCFVLLFSISTELLATFSIFGGLAFAGAYLLDPGLRPTLRRAVPPLLFAGLLSAILLSPYLWSAFHSVPSKPLHGVGGASVDALSWFLPRSIIRFGGATFLSTTGRFVANASEDGAYLPPTLLLVLALALFRGRRDRTTWLLFAFAAVAAVLAMGSVLRFKGRDEMPLPWVIGNHVPVLQNALPQRFAMYVWLVVAVIVARWLAAPRSDGRAWMAWMAIAISALLLYPDVWAAPLHKTSASPIFFQNNHWQAIIPKGSTILIVRESGPEGKGLDMLWQSAADYGFSMPQGYTGPEPPEFANDPIWSSLRTGALFGISAPALRSWLRSHGVSYVVVVLPNPQQWDGLLRAATHSGPIQRGDIWIYPVK